MSIEATLNKFGKVGVAALKQDVQKVSATGETADSIHFTVTHDADIYHLIFLARKYFSTLETGRGPRKSSEYGGFDDKMLEYMNARGIGADLTDKKRKQLARFLTYKINKEGDQTFKKGGRVVYSPTITKLVEEITTAIAKDFKELVITRIRNGFNTSATAGGNPG